QPLAPTSYAEVFYSKSDGNTSNATNRKIAIDDTGLYIAGDGTQTSKDLLKTADGYVYAIPLFRVKRRNSGGYSQNNGNGARELIYFTGISYRTTVINVGDTITRTIT